MNTASNGKGLPRGVLQRYGAENSPPLVRESAAPRVFRFREVRLTLGRVPRIVGIVNVTPDSFSDGGRHLDPHAAVMHAHAMARAGAAIIDVGGESTRPGSTGTSVCEELDRVLPVIDALMEDRRRGELEACISIDTRKPEVARAALQQGCHLLNDVSAAADPGMVELLREFSDVPVVLMHMKGDPKTMQNTPHYDDVVGEVAAFLATRASRLEESGIDRDRIVIDPGIGFGKRFRDNLVLLNRVDEFHSLGYPVLVGASRKRFLGELLDAGPGDRLSGSLAAAAACYMSGVEFVRAHDVLETARLLRVLDAVAHPEDYNADW
jgi:dihydropteroate synthase